MLISVESELFSIVFSCVLLLDDVHLEVLELAHHVQRVSSHSEISVLLSTTEVCPPHQCLDGIFYASQLFFDWVDRLPQVLELLYQHLHYPLSA